MIDHILGRPSPTWKRAQVVLILLFWTSVLFKGPPNGPTRLVQRLSARFKRWTPWQIIVATLTAAYATKNAQHLLSLNAPEPLARLYSRSYYRATYVATALDAGFATAMNIRPKPLRDLLSVLFSGYYLLFANDADEKMRKYRALCSVEMLRATWNKTDNPLLRLATARHRPKVAIHRKLELRRPKESKYTKPIVVHLFFDGSEEELREADELVTDIPGGGFCAMSPTAHEERLLRWAKRIKRPVASVDYSKAPEHPYPYAIDEIVDLYRLLTSTQGAVVGLGGRKSLKMVWTGDSAGANIATAALFTLLETLPADQQNYLPVGLVFSYPAFSFNFAAWMRPDELRVLRQEESTAQVSAIAEEKAHLTHRSPLSVVGDDRRAARSLRRRTKSWSKSLRSKSKGLRMTAASSSKEKEVNFSLGAETDEDEDPEEEHALAERVKTPISEVGLEGILDPAAPLKTRLTMSSRTSYFGDRIIAPTMMRAMAILYVGPSPVDLSTNYFISPILAPSPLLARLPRIHIVCGERDPLVDDAIIFVGRVREARREAGLADTDDISRVSLRLVEGWSHGFLQMIALLPGVDRHMDALADEIVDAFARAPSEAVTGEVVEGRKLTSSPQPLPTISSQPMSGLVETADLLRRRREEAVEGITATPPPESKKPTPPAVPKTPGMRDVEGFPL